MKRINIIGFGNTGFTFYEHLKHRAEIVGVFTRKDQLTTVPKVDRLDKLSDKVDLNIVCVSDDAIGTVAEKLPLHIPVVHTSGTVRLDVFSNFERRGVLYPLQTLSRIRSVRLEGVPFLIEANTSELEQEITKFCKQHLSSNCFTINSESRLKVHLSAVMANNFSTYLFGLATEILRNNQLPEDLLNPLLQETVSKFIALGYEQSQTGPARRSDEGTIERHLALLKDPQQKELYTLISKAIADRFNF